MTISTVICAYTIDRWSQLELAVASVQAQQDVTSEVVIVIDHNDELLAMSRAAWPDHVVIANSGAKGLSGARNTGVVASHGSIIAFLDDDARAEPHWLAALQRHFADPLVGGAGGHVAPAWSGPEPAWLPEEFRWVIGCSYRGQPDHVADVRNPIGANMAFRREVFDRVGGFREGIGRVGTIPLGCEETELSIRAGTLGYRVVYDPAAVVSHTVPTSRITGRYFVRRCFAEGMSKALVSRFAGRTEGLSSERSYVSQVLPRGFASGLGLAFRGPDRLAGAGRSAAIAVGLVSTALGFVRGSAGADKVAAAMSVAPPMLSASPPDLSPVDWQPTELDRHSASEGGSAGNGFRAGV